MDFQGTAKRLDDFDIPRIGAAIGVGEDEIRAFMEVEAAGSGFDRHDRPKMLFEPHVFFRNLTGEERDQAVGCGLAYKSWRRNYPRDSYPRLMEAMKINKLAALKSCSWGLGQILGENFRMVGYDSPVEMVEDFMEDEENHLMAMIEYLVAAGIDDDLREHRWEAVARVYNGPAYATHGYHTRLRDAFKRWQAVADVNAPDGAAAQPTRAALLLRKGDRGTHVRALQEALVAKGYNLGAVDGHFGNATRNAVMAFQADNDLLTDGIVGANTWLAIDEADPAPVSQARMETTVADLREKGSNQIKGADKTQAVGAGTLVLGTVGSLQAAVGQGEDTLGALERGVGLLGPVTTFVENNWMFLLVLIGGFIVWRAYQDKLVRLADHKYMKNLGR